MLSAPLDSDPKQNAKAGATVGLSGSGLGARGSFHADAHRAEPSETAKKVRHIANLLETAGAPYSEDLAAAWITPFCDDPDPSYVVELWLAAGWRDPWLVAAVVDIFDDLEHATAAMRYVDADLGSSYSLVLIRRLLEAQEELQRDL